MDNSYTHDQILAGLETASRAAGVLVLDAFKSRSFSVRTKDDRTVVTDIDFKAQRLIQDLLATRFPGIECMGEEGERSRVSGSERLFVVDPIDGTANFALGIPFFAVSLAFLENGSPVIAALHDPIHDNIFLAVKGKGGFRNGVPLSPPRYRGLRSASINVNLSKVPDTVRTSLLRRLDPGSSTVRNLGSSSLEMAYTATGLFDCVIKYGLSIWDVAAAGLVLEEAGGKWTTSQGIKPSPIDTTFGAYAAGTATLHSELLDLLGPLPR